MMLAGIGTLTGRENLFNQKKIYIYFNIIYNYFSRILCLS